MSVGPPACAAGTQPVDVEIDRNGAEPLIDQPVLGALAYLHFNFGDAAGSDDLEHGMRPFPGVETAYYADHG